VILVIHYVLLAWWSEIRRGHSWVSSLFPTLDTAVSVTRAQRIAVLCLSILVNMAFSALFMGTEPKNVSETLVASIFASLVMFPVLTIFPILFRMANTYATSWRAKACSCSIACNPNTRLARSSKVMRLIVMVGYTIRTIWRKWRVRRGGHAVEPVVAGAAAVGAAVTPRWRTVLDFLRSLVMVSSASQTFVGFYMVTQALYLAFTDANRTVTVAVILIPGFVMLLLGLFAFVLYRKDYGVVASMLLVMSVAAELVSVLLLVFGNFDGAFESLRVFLSVHAGILGTAVLCAVFLSRQRRRQHRLLRKSATKVVHLHSERKSNPSAQLAFRRSAKLISRAFK
jgi:hypothetical protein